LSVAEMLKGVLQLDRRSSFWRKSRSRQACRPGREGHAEAARRIAEGNYGCFAVLAFANLMGRELDYAQATMYSKRLAASC
jgi:hypothetical protein